MTQNLGSRKMKRQNKQDTGLSMKLSPNHPYHRVVRSLDYDENQGKFYPRFGKVIGIYDSLGSKVLIPEETDLERLSTRIKAVLPGDCQSKSSDLPQLKKGEMYVGLTEACNLSCPGCAVGVDKIKPQDARFLDVKSMESYLESLFKSAYQKGMTELHIKWAGGEPLLQKSYKLIGQLQSLVRSWEKRLGIKVRQTILTNGVYASDEVVAFCKSKNIHLSISLWGTAEYQDKMRRPRSGQESYSAVVKNIGRCVAQGISFNINYVLTPGNASDFANFIKSLWDVSSDLYIGKQWAKPVLVPLGITFFRPPKAYDSKLREVLAKKLVEGLREGFVVILDLIKAKEKLPPLYKIDYLDLFSTRMTTCGSGRSYVAAGLNGVFNCHHDLSENTDGQVTEEDNLFDAVLGKYKGKSHLLSVDNMRIPDDLLWLKYHGIAGCPRLSQLENNQEMGHLSSAAKIYRDIADEVLSLETMRQINC